MARDKADELMDRKQKRQLERLGCEVIQAKSGHYKIYLNGHYVLTDSATSSDWRAWRNLTARLRRLGIDVK